jgi:glycosyltransferase involved in cell wall biosynthesis
MPLLSIIVVAFNERKHMPALTDALAKLRLPDGVETETIVVDGGSQDGTVAAARACEIKNILELPGANIPVCRNAGIAAAAGDWIAFLDGDCLPEPDWIEQALPFLSQAEPVIIGWPVEPPSPGTWVQRAWYLHWSHKNPHRETWNGREIVRHEAFRLLTTRNMLMNRHAAETLQGFDEKLPTGEDTDFVFRAYQRGFFVAGVPELRVHHLGEPATLRDFFRQQCWHANRSSYKKIMAESGGRVGGNAPRFTALYLGFLVLAIVGVIASLIMGHTAMAAIHVLPWLGLILVPSARTAFRAKQPSAWPALAILYATYGWARTLDLLGFHRRKASWKSSPPPRR